jgi:chitinase
MMIGQEKNKIRLASVFAFFLFFCMIGGSVPGSADAGSENIWVSAYYAGWMQGCGYEGHLSAEQIDFGAVTHVLHFSLMPNPDGSLDDSINCITEENSTRLLTAAHAAGKKVLISVGCWATESDFLLATGSGNRAKFISNLVSFLTRRGYDGIDIDWEPLSLSSSAQYNAFITELRDALNTITPRPLLTAAALWEPGILASVQDKLDQINIMTYELSGPWPGWITWHNAPLYDGGYWFQSTGAPVPSADGLVEDFLSAGIAPGKLGIGIEFYGAVWSGGTGTPTGGVTAPGQSWTIAPSVEVIPYYQIMDSYYQSSLYRWDSAANAPYLSIDTTGSSYDKFISYDDEMSCPEKIQYVKQKGIGGIMIFELGGGWRPSAPVPDLLLQTVKQFAWESTLTIPDAPVLLQPLNNSVNVSVSPVLTWNPSPGADSYAVQVSATPSFSVLLVNRTGIQSTSLTVSGLLSSTTYYWHIKAMNTAGSSEWSEIRAFTTLPAVSATIISSFTAAPQKRSILLTWQTTSEYNNTGFEIERRDTTTNNWTKIGFVAGTGTSSIVKTYSFTDKKVIKGTTYGYRLKQMNNDGTYTYSTEVTVKI